MTRPRTSRLAVVGVLEDGVPEVAQRRAGHIEGTEHGVLRRTLRGAERAHLDQARDAKRVREQDELLPRVAARVADRREEVDAGAPLLAARPDLGNECVEVADGRFHDLLEPVVRRSCEAAHHIMEEPIAAC